MELEYKEWKCTTSNLIILNVLYISKRRKYDANILLGFLVKTLIHKFIDEINNIPMNTIDRLYVRR